MKYLPYIFLIILITIMSMCFMKKPKKCSSIEYEYLRIHIVANSNSTEDQQLKYKIKNNLINFLTPYLAECDDKEKAKNTINVNLEAINLIALNTIHENGFDYDLETKLTKEYFPTRYYENYTLEAGEYDALVLNIGNGEGNNWWCVVYPPLCFVNKNSNKEQNSVYQSKILKIIKRFFD